MNHQRRKTIAALSSLAATAALRPAASLATAAPVRIGYAVPQTGPFAIVAQVTQERPTILWAEQLNAAGGLEVQGMRRRIELIGYDDRGEADLTTQHYLKLMTADKVDLILAPWSSKANSAVAPLANKYGYPLLASTAQSRKLLDMNLPYFFSVLQEPDKMMQAVVEVLVDKGVRTIGILYMDDLFGLENLSGLQLAMRGKALQISEQRAYSPGVKDLTPALQAIKDSKADAFVGLTYPAETFLAAKQASEIQFNPKLFFTAVATAFPAYRKTLGPAAEGVLGLGSWNPKTSAGAKAFFDAHVKRFHEEPDRWASGHAYAGLQILQQSVQHIGLDRRALREYIASHEFETIIGPMRFVGGENVAFPGTVGQWQGSEFEIVWPPSRATAPLEFPKVHWAQHGM
jgi:branched-chain amino acid transport system substrate-binding protein